MTSDKNKLTEKQKRFCDFFIKTGNGAQSARLAGYKGKNLNVIASENLIKPNIKSYIDEQIAKKDSKRIMQADEVLELLTSAARGEIKEECIVNESEDKFLTKAIIKKKQITPGDRLKATQMLAKRYGLLDKKQDNVDNAIKAFFKALNNEKDEVFYED